MKRKNGKVDLKNKKICKYLKYAKTTVWIVVYSSLRQLL